MSSTIVTVADAVVASLNGNVFTPTFTATRAYRPVFDLVDLTTIHVTVVPKGFTREGGTRGAEQGDFQIDVAVQQKVASDSAEVLDPLMDLVEDIAKFLRRQRPESYTDAICLKVENSPVYSPEHLNEQRVFTSVLTLTYRVMG